MRGEGKDKRKGQNRFTENIRIFKICYVPHVKTCLLCEDITMPVVNKKNKTKPRKIRLSNYVSNVLFWFWFVWVTFYVIDNKMKNSLRDIILSITSSYFIFLFYQMFSIKSKFSHKLLLLQTKTPIFLLSKIKVSKRQKVAVL